MEEFLKETGNFLFGLMVLVGAALWIVALLVAPAAIIKLCMGFLLG